MAAIFFKLAFFITLFHSGTAIRCFICQSKSNVACQDPIKSYQLQLTECTPDVMLASSRELGRALGELGTLGPQLGMELMTPPPGHTYAPMHCQKISFYVGNEHVIVRGCQATSGWSGGPRAMCRVLQDNAAQSSESYVEYCDTCDRDACNAATTRAPAPPASLVAPLVALLVAAVRAAR